MHPNEYAKVRAGAMPAAATHLDSAIEVPSPRSAPQSPSGPPELDDDTLLTSAQTRTRIGGVSTMCIWRWMRDPRVQFPLPVKIGFSRRNYWQLGELRRWQAERVTKAAS
jgi:predicted DNA-binding transcriptional regulator AlpA